MKHRAVLLMSIAWATLFSCSVICAADPPAERVLALYFHRTVRCPTCVKMGGLAEEAVKQGFEKQVQEGKVEFRFIDFQAEENAKLKKAYKITGPALIVVKIVDNKVQEQVDLKDIWKKVQGDKEEFLKYVRDHVAAYLPK